MALKNVLERCNTVMEQLKEYAILLEAMHNNEFELHYQPIVDAVTTDVLWVEALMRWNNPIIGNVSPEIFIPLLEENKLMIQVGTWVLGKACRQLKRWRDVRKVNYGISVNVSPLQLKQRDFAEIVYSTLIDNELNPENLLIEITESKKLNADASVVRTLKALKEIGVRISIDDFGTGYNSLIYLQEFEFTSLKIDRSFVSNMKNERGKILAESIISIGHRMGVKVVAEGIENSEQYKNLREMGCDMFQGYYFCRPLPADDVFSFYINNQYRIKSKN